MSKKQLGVLFACSTVIWAVGTGLLPLLPVYLTKVGATTVMSGYYLSFTYLALALGTVAAGWLSDRLQRRKLLLILGGVVMVPVLWLMGRATNMWQLAALTATAWFCGGLELTAISIIAGLFADQAERGKVFGILAMTTALGQLVGGATVGPIVDRWGYATVFSGLSIFAILAPVIALLTEDNPATPTVRGSEAATGQKRLALGSGLALLVAARLTSAVAIQATNLAVPLAMNTLGFAVAAITSATAVGGAVSLPLRPTVGWLSDRLGRRRFLILGQLAGAAGLMIYARSASLWHFWLGISVVALQTVVEASVGQALVTDLVPQEVLGRGMSLYVASGWVGGTVGFTAAGHAIEGFGPGNALALGAVLCVVAAVLILSIRGRALADTPATATASVDPPDAQ